MKNIDKYKQVIRRLSQDLGREPIPEEIATEMGLALEKIYNIKKYEKNNNNTTIRRSIKRN